MAITIATEPQNFTTTSNPCVFTFSSDNSTEDGFSFYVELTINGSVHSFHQVFVESTDTGKFDCSEILRTIVYSDLKPDTTLDLPYTDAILSYSIRVREKYGDPPVLTGSFVGSNTVRAFNGALRHQDWIGYTYTDYDVVTTSGALFLTDFPRAETYWCGLSESIFLTCINSTQAAAGIQVVLYDTTGSVVATLLSASLTASYLQAVDVSPQSLIDNTSITTANLNDTYYYTVKVTSTNSTELFKIYIDRECTQYTARRLHWVNKYGAWDSYSFIMYSETSAKVSGSTYQKETGGWNSSDAWVYQQYTGQNLSYTKTSEDTLKLSSDWIKQDKQQWLVKSLMESPKVLLEISQGVFEPVVVQTNSYTQKNKIKEGLIREDVTVLRTYEYRSQLN